jgi:hypothetical protein
LLLLVVVLAGLVAVVQGDYLLDMLALHLVHRIL